MAAQRRVAAFAAEQGYDGDPAYRLLDLAAEVGELAADATKSTGWGDDPEALAVSEDEVGDALFSLLLLAETLDVDAGDALDAALSKYRQRIEDTGDASSRGA